ncbi:hypothetical protein ABBQ38_012966 [Trebouxia sp. C0009 RCD-2024]
MAHIEVQDAPSLTPELWASVFAHLQDLLENAVVGSPERKQAEVHRLKLVCKQFRDAFASHPRLVKRLFLGDDLLVSQLPGLLAWLQQNKSSVLTLQSECRRSVFEAVLPELVSSQAALRSINVTGVLPSLLVPFSSLEKCVLWHSEGTALNLTPLGRLPRLSHLVLRGHFRQLRHIAGLTRLECLSTDTADGLVLDVHKFAPTLQHFAVEYCLLLGVDTLGLSACPGLTHLALRGACLKFRNGLVYLDKDLSVFPSNLQLLGQLHALNLSSKAQLPSMVWTSALTSLQNLSISFRSSHHFSIRHALLLTNLTRLQMTAHSIFGGDRSVLSIAVPWHKLQALKVLVLCGFRLKLDVAVVSLLQLPHLKQITFADSIAAEEYDSECFTELVHNLARLRPEVNLFV